MDRTFDFYFSKAGAKVLLFFDMTKFFRKKMHFTPHFFTFYTYSPSFLTAK